MAEHADAGAGSSPTQPPTSSLSRQVRLIGTVFIVAVLSLVGVAALAYRSTLKNAENDRWVDHTYEVALTAEQLFSDERGAAATARGYLVTGDPKFLTAYDSFHASIAHGLDALAMLVADNPDEVVRVARLRSQSDTLLQQLADTVKARKSDAPKLAPALIDLVTDTNHGMAVVRTTTSELTAAEDQLLVIRRETVVRGERITLMIVVGGGTLSLAVLLICLWLLTREIIDRRRAETSVVSLNRELAARNAELESSNRELEGFTYSISHDLRAPLRAIDGFSKLLQTRYIASLDAEAVRLLDVVRDNSRNMATLIDDLLAFSRMGRKSLETEMLDMPALVGECIAEVLRSQKERPNIVVGPLPHCLGDRTLVRQVWVNLIGNAVKYSGQNPRAQVEITGREEARECIYSVRDNGVGFDMQYYHKLFGVFQRLHRVEEFPGTGVGLAIAMRAVTKHGGRLWADAALERGATFLFSLPRTESTR